MIAGFANLLRHGNPAAEVLTQTCLFVGLQLPDVALTRSPEGGIRSRMGLPKL